jgi:hypothetical protein
VSTAIIKDAVALVTGANAVAAVPVAIVKETNAVMMQPGAFAALSNVIVKGSFFTVDQQTYDAVAELGKGVFAVGVAGHGGTFHYIKAHHFFAFSEAL